MDAEVVVVGTGPTGGAAALALATYGVRVIALTRYRWLSNTPRAHITNQRAMEVLRDLGVAAEVARYGSPWELMGDTLFATSLAGEELARIRAWGTGDDRHGDYVRASPEPMRDVPQPDLEAVLVKTAAARGAELLFSTEYLDHEEDADRVTVRLCDRRSGREYTLRANYLIGADGANSRVLTNAGLRLEGEMGRANTAYVQFDADLSRHVAHRPSILYWIISPAAAYGEIGMGLLRAVRTWDRWIAGWGYDPADGGPDFRPEALVARIRTLVGDPDLDPVVTGTSTWQVNQAVAPGYATERVFCAGDAVHRHPPSNGLGSNTSIQDAFNLAWKLAYMLRGYAGPGLLASYSPERAPVGAAIVARANRSRAQFQPVHRAIAVADAEDPLRALVARIRDSGRDGIEARRALAQAIATKNAEFNAHGVELNQRYVSTAVIPDPTAAPEEFARDPELYAQPTSRPGAKLPHCWVVSADGRRRSTLDLVGAGRFTVVTGLGGTAWRDAVAAIDEHYLTVAVVGGPDAQDLYFEWARVREVAEAGAILVRPDGYIAWRHSDPVTDPDAAERLLRGALAAVLDTPALAGIAMEELTRRAPGKRPGRGRPAPTTRGAELL